MLEDDKNALSHCSYADYIKSSFLPDSNNQTKRNLLTTLMNTVGYIYSYTHYDYISNLLEFAFFFLAQFRIDIYNKNLLFSSLCAKKLTVYVSETSMGFYLITQSHEKS